MKNIFNLMKTSHSDGDYDEEPLTDCCDAPFAHPDLDICSKCHEHADVSEQDAVWLPDKHADEDAESIFSNGLSFRSKGELQEYLNTLYHYEGDELGEAVPQEHVDAVWDKLKDKESYQDRRISR